MGLISLNIGGLTRYSNELLKTAPYRMLSTVTDPGVLVALPSSPNDSVSMEVAAENGWCDGVTTCGSVDTADGIWNVAYISNFDAINVLTDDAFIVTGSPIYVGLNGRATAVQPTISHFLIGISMGPSKDTTLCDGTISSCVPVVFEKVRTFIEVTAVGNKNKLKSAIREEV